MCHSTTTIGFWTRMPILRSRNRQRVHLSNCKPHGESALLMRFKMVRTRVRLCHDRRARGMPGKKIKMLRRRLHKDYKMWTCNKKTKTRKSRQRRKTQRRGPGGREYWPKFLVGNSLPWHNDHADVFPVSPENTSGLRRGKRLRYEPLEWWRCEKVVYGRRDPGKKTYVPTIKEIVRIPKDEPKPLGVAAHKTKRGSVHRRTTTQEPATDDNPEEGWDEKTPTNGVVIDWFTGNEVSRRTLIISAEM